MQCKRCDSNYVLNSAIGYVCGGYLGGSCDNSWRLNRDVCEKVLLGPVFDELLAPDRGEKMDREIERRVRAALASLLPWLEPVPGCPVENPLSLNYKSCTTEHRGSC